MEKRRSKLFLTFILTGTFLLAGLVFSGSLRVQKGSPQPESFASTEMPVDEKETTVDVISPNEKATLTMKGLKKADGTLKQTFFISLDLAKESIEIYAHESNPSYQTLIPYNTFSPDNKYIFLKIEDPERAQYIVVRTDGKNIKGEEKSVEITSLFYEKYEEFVITDVTGWGGYSLIVVNTNYKDGKIGPSFWFDLSNFSFIQLSNRFN
ncbi:MAG: hypothetical protein UT08_C0015G0022 [Candidatus Woesebacteria bacterium GW2011_GWB1_38_8]|uniref:Uncharacterized protein n=1 Tax=Candidatus Woesebacteria bacterium GW2011_GWB1_38_8 TaxID=1618570 RepID=A0A0G0P5W1_9BACT|nr:MAG: hypothetical protein UT08_C0015G0022 [Candidatus Woesebacteria bacterium GW2011_GWB1_38_8]